jgi:hypothetical protein
MAFKTLTVNEEAHTRLRQHKEPGESFSDVILREVPPPPLKTCGEIEDYFREHGVPKANPRLRAAMLAGRGRRSNRPAVR